MFAHVAWLNERLELFVLLNKGHCRRQSFGFLFVGFSSGMYVDGFRNIYSLVCFLRRLKWDWLCIASGIKPFCYCRSCISQRFFWLETEVFSGVADFVL